MRTCPNCREDQPDDYFILDDAGVVCDTCAQATRIRTPGGLKTCDLCGERKPVTEFRGTRCHCHDCEKSDRRKRYARKKRDKKLYFANKDHRDCPKCGRIMVACQCPPPPPPTSKVCPGCETALLFAAFGPDTKRVNGLSVYCRQCMAERRRMQRAANARRMGHTAVVTGADTDTGPSEPFA